ncbi:MAG: hypothetical protein WCE68_07190 [Anaerolineales bacterium]
MTGITHKQARHYINALADALIKEQEQADLDAHLEACEECRAYAAQMQELESRLQHSFHERWGLFQGPSESLGQNVQSKARRIVMSNRIDLGLRLIAGVAALIVLGLAFSLVIGQLKSRSTKNPAAGSTVTAGPTATALPTTTVVPSSGRLIAFVSEQAGNSDIYVMKADGSGVADLTNDPAYYSDPVWSPDGTKIAFESNRNGNLDIFVMDPDGSGLTQLTHGPSNHILGASPSPQRFGAKVPDVWSPDSRQILFSGDGTGRWVLSAMNADGSGAAQLIQPDDPPAQAAFWSPSGRQVAYTSQTGNGWMQIVAVNVDGTNRRVMATGDPARSNAAWNSGGIIAWSKDEQSIYYEYQTEDGSSWYIMKTTADGANTARIIASGSGIPEGVYDQGWLGNDAVLYYETETVASSDNVTIWHKTDDGKALHWDVLAICGISPNTSTGSYPVENEAASHGGSQSILALQCSNKNSGLYFLDIKTGAINEIAQIQSNWSDCIVSWSADDQLILIQGKDQSGKAEFYILNAGDLQTKTTVTPRLIWSGESSQAILQPVPFNNAAAENRLPVVPTLPPITTKAALWTDTSRRNLIAFTSDLTGGDDIYVARSDGSGATDLTNSPESSGAPAWSPDGKTIAFTRYKNGSVPAIYVMNPDGTNLRQVSEDGISVNTWPPNGQELAWSPDSQKIAYLVSQPQDLSNPNGPAKMSLKVVDLGGNILQSVDLGIFSVVTQLRWSPDGHSLDYVATQTATDASGATSVTESDIDQVSLADQLPEVIVKSGQQIDAWIGSGPTLTYLVRDAVTWKLIRSYGQSQNKLAAWAVDSGQCGLAGLSSSDAASSWDKIASSSFMRWSPDGKRLLIEANCPGAAWLYLGNLDGQFVKLMNIPVFSSGVGPDTFSWSPDGHTIIFTSDMDSTGNLDLYELNVEAALKDPSTRPIRITTSGFAESSPDWQPLP